MTREKSINAFSLRVKSLLGSDRQLGLKFGRITLSLTVIRETRLLGQKEVTDFMYTDFCKNSGFIFL